MCWKIVSVIFSLFLFSCSNSKSELSEIAIEQEASFTVPIYNGPDFTPYWNVPNTDTFHTIAPFNFMNQFNEQFTSNTVANKFYVVNFFFTTCNSICPKMMNNMEIVANHFDADSNVLFISHTVTPWIDNPEKLLDYSKLFQVKKNKWHLVTGEKSELYHLARKSYFVEEEPGFNKDSSEFLHTEHFILIDNKNHIRGIYNGTLELEMQRIIDDLNWLLKNEK